MNKDQSWRSRMYVCVDQSRNLADHCDVTTFLRDFESMVVVVMITFGPLVANYHY
jgi:hypothetical protein